MYKLKLHQIVRLREALQKWRKSAQCRSRNLPRSAARHGSRRGDEGSSPRVPSGHLAVYVGQERKRFVIKTSLLSHPLFKALLKKTEEEVGFHYEGGLTIPCDAPAFQRLLLLMQGKHAVSNNMPIMMMRVIHAYDPHAARPHEVQANVLGEQHPHGFQRLLQELLRLHITEVSSHLTTGCRLPESRLPDIVDGGGLRQTVYV